MRRAALALAALAAASLPLWLAGCDWIQFAFMNSIPVHGDPSRNPDVYVYIGVDGMPYSIVQEAMRRGAFSGPEWKLAKFITQFPGTSDASWTRIMHTEKLNGYEFEYYDPNSDTVHNHGLMGDALHLMPTISESFMDFEFKYLKAFDYSANGYTSSLEAYRNTHVSLANTLDAMFDLLGGRAQTSSVFSAYMIEVDVLGHMTDAESVTRAVKKLSDRIAAFRERHPERNFHFTILSDHGMDFTNVPNDNMIDFTQELGKVGIQTVETLKDHDPSRELFAIPIMHTRVSYLALHTHPSLVDEVAGHVAQLPSVDFAVARLKTPPSVPKDTTVPEWFAIWSEGKMTAWYGFDPATDKYYLPKGADYARIGINGLSFGSSEDFKAMTDDDLFALTKNATYPDLFYRVRTALSPVGVNYPCDVMVSFRSSFGSLGFRLPFGAETTTAGFHGALQDLATVGTLLSTERDLPDAVRADTFLQLFPRMKQHILDRGLEYVEGDPNASLSYK